MRSKHARGPRRNHQLHLLRSVRSDLMTEILQNPDLAFDEYEKQRLEAYLTRALTEANGLADVYYLLPDDLARWFFKRFFERSGVSIAQVQEARTLSDDVIEAFKNEPKNQDDGLLVVQRMLYNYIIED